MNQFLTTQATESNGQKEVSTNIEENKKSATEPEVFFFRIMVVHVTYIAYFLAMRLHPFKYPRLISIERYFINARRGIRTLELLRDWTLNPTPLTCLGYPRILRHISRKFY